MFSAMQTRRVFAGVESFFFQFISHPVALEVFGNISLQEGIHFGHDEGFVDKNGGPVSIGNRE
jgi:hypothetical protein